MQKYYEEIKSIADTTFIVSAKSVFMGEVARVTKGDGSFLFAIVISIDGDDVCMQAMGSLKGVSNGDRVAFMRRFFSVKVGDGILGHIFNGKGEVIDKDPLVECEDRDLQRDVANPVNRVVPGDLISTNIPMIDLFNSLVKSQKISIFTTSGEPYNDLLMRISNQTDADIVILGLMSTRQDDLRRFEENARLSGSFNKTVLFVHMATDYPVECLMIPDMALTVAEEFAQHGKSVLVLLTDMTAYADSLKEISISLEQVPSNRGYPGSLYSSLASRYEKAIDLGDGSVTIVSATTMPGDDVTHPVPDNTGYITEGQFYLKDGRIEAFGSLSRLKQYVIGGPKSRDDHGDLMNAMIRLYADSLKAKELYTMGFKPSEFDKKLIKYGDYFEKEMMDLNVNISLIDALDLGWNILRKSFDRSEIGIKEALLEKYW